ncbi:hypothetical protein J6590_011031 [Homalodisca vitripennis]|nr:hypothetical protein J6590_011031 [Homalodisca vitripennis]
MVFLRMEISITILVLVVVATKTVHGIDPSSCHRNMKFMLIAACGATKREFQLLPKYSVMSPEEVERRYQEMVKANMIKGMDKDDIDVFDYESNRLNENNDYDDSSDFLLFSRIKRSIIGLSKDRYFAEPFEHDKMGSFQFMGRLPVALSAKCCSGQALCSVDDFKGFCG